MQGLSRFVIGLVKLTISVSSPNQLQQLIDWLEPYTAYLNKLAKKADLNSANAIVSFIEYLDALRDFLNSSELVESLVENPEQFREKLIELAQSFFVEVSLDYLTKPLNEFEKRIIRRYLDQIRELLELSKQLDLIEKDLLNVRQTILEPEQAELSRLYEQIKNVIAELNRTTGKVLVRLGRLQAQHREPSETIINSDTLETVFESLIKQIKLQPVLPTGYPELDMIFDGGLLTNSLFVVALPTGQGKTNFMQNIMSNWLKFAVKYPNHAKALYSLFFASQRSIEIDEKLLANPIDNADQIYQVVFQNRKPTFVYFFYEGSMLHTQTRFWNIVFHSEVAQLRDETEVSANRITEDYIKKLEQLSKQLLHKLQQHNIPISIVFVKLDKRGTTVSAIREKLIELEQNGYAPIVVLIDYLSSIFKPSGKVSSSASEHAIQTIVVDELYSLTDEYTIVIAQQFRKMVLGQADITRLTKDDLQGFARIGQVADYIIGGILNFGQNEYLLKILKHRYKAVENRILRLKFDPRTARISSYLETEIPVAKYVEAILLNKPIEELRAKTLQSIHTTMSTISNVSDNQMTGISTTSKDEKEIGSQSQQLQIDLGEFLD